MGLRSVLGILENLYVCAGWQAQIQWTHSNLGIAHPLQSAELHVLLSCFEAFAAFFEMCPSLARNLITEELPASSERGSVG